MGKCNEAVGTSKPQLVDIAEAKAYIEANYPNDPLLRQIVLNLLEKLPKVEPVWIPFLDLAEGQKKNGKTRLIDAEALIDHLTRCIERSRGLMRSLCYAIKCYVEKMPTVDAQIARSGMWIGEGDGYADGELVYDLWHCSECNYCIDDGSDDPDDLPKYCPHCGAKMSGGAGYDTAESH